MSEAKRYDRTSAVWLNHPAGEFVKYSDVESALELQRLMQCAVNVRAEILINSRDEYRVKRRLGSTEVLGTGKTPLEALKDAFDKERVE